MQKYRLIWLKIIFQLQTGSPSKNMTNATMQPNVKMTGKDDVDENGNGRRLIVAPSDQNTEVARVDNDADDIDCLRTRRRRTGVVAMTPRRHLCVDRPTFQFPSVEKLVRKYSRIISDQQRSSAKCASWKDRYFSLADKPPTPDSESVAGLGDRSPTASDEDGSLWLVDSTECCEKRSGSDSAIELNDGKSAARVGIDEEYTFDVVQEESLTPMTCLTPRTNLRRRQTWTGPLFDETNSANPTPSRLSVRKTCSLDQSMRKLNKEQQCQQQNGLRWRYLYRGGRNGSVFSNEDVDEDEMRCRSARTPSVVISDHSDDPNFASSTITLQEIEEFQKCRLNDQLNSLFGDSSSDCSMTSIWSNFNNCTNLLDNEYEIVDCRRKISDCSTCSTFSCEDYEETKTKVSRKRYFKTPNYFFTFYSRLNFT